MVETKVVEIQKFRNLGNSKINKLVVSSEVEFSLLSTTGAG